MPTGNFGDILAGYYAKLLGLPVNKLVCASNKNNVLTDFIKTGEYNKNRDFYTTHSPSMDILISSNLERFIYNMSGNDSAATKEYMDALARDGKYAVSPEIKEKMQKIPPQGGVAQFCIKKRRIPGFLLPKILLFFIF